MTDITKSTAVVDEPVATPRATIESHPRPLQFPSARIEDAESITSSIRREIEENHTAVSARLERYINRNRSWVSRLLPTQLDRVLRDTQLRQAETEGAFQERLLALATDTKVEAARESTDAWLKSLKVGVRERFFEFISARYQNLQHTVEQRREEFGHHMRGRYRTLESYRDMPELAQRYRKSMDEEMDQYLLWIDGLLDRFRSIVTEKITSYDPGLPAPRS